MVTCQACGTENPSDSEYCSKCARKLDVDTQAAVVEQRATHTATGIRWSAVIAVLAVLILVILFVLLLATHAI